MSEKMNLLPHIYVLECTNDVTDTYLNEFVANYDDVANRNRYLISVARSIANKTPDNDRNYLFDLV